ncbi:MAG TPA: RNA-binding protein [Gammaproteobacteria bacterium]|nr:RNA-binding protein [Gammaproteobacteria bacterium]
MLLGNAGAGSHHLQGNRSGNAATNIYVGNLADNTSNSDLESTFSAYGTVKSVNIIKDRETGSPRGFGFIEMDSFAAGDAAIAALNETVLLGQTINVNRARAKRHRRGPQQRNNKS